MSLNGYNYETDSMGPIDTSAYHGLYTVTEETKGCTGFGRIFKNANGKYLYGFSYNSWEQATDSSSAVQWCISDEPGYSGDYGAIIFTSSTYDSLVMPNEVTSWTAMMYEVNSVTITPTVTAPATEAIPMVLKATAITSYNTTTKQWTDGDVIDTYNSFESEPIVDWYYTAAGSHLIGTSIDSKVSEGLFVSFNEYKTICETGQELVYEGTYYFKTLYGVPCITYDGAQVDVLSSNYLVIGNKPFSVCAFVKVDDDAHGNFHLCEAYNTDWSNGNGFEICLMDGTRFYIRGGGIKDDGLNTVDTYSFPKRTWVHFAYTYNNGWNTVYINGKLVWKKYCIRTFPQPTYDKITIGNTLDRRDFWWGSIAEFKYFSNIISETQIKKEADRCLAMVTEN